MLLQKIFESRVHSGEEAFLVAKFSTLIRSFSSIFHAPTRFLLARNMQPALSDIWILLRCFWFLPKKLVKSHYFIKLCKACLGFLRGLKSFDMIPGWFDNHWIIFKATTLLHMIIRQIFVAFLDNLNFTAQKNRMPKLRLLLLAIWLDTIYEPAT